MKIVGWIITLVGFGFLFVKAFGSMTGFVISETIQGAPDYFYLVGVVMLVVGILLVMLSKRKK